MTEISLREAWGDWIGRQPWDLFVTLTSEKQTHPEAMTKRFRYCMKTAETFVYGRKREPAGHTLQWVVGLERTKQGWPHTHAVVRFPHCVDGGIIPKDVFDLAYWQKWMTATGGYAWLEIPRSQQAVVNYVTKYITKGGDLDLSRNLDFPASQWSQILLVDDQRVPGTRAQRAPGPVLDTRPAEQVT